MSRLGLSSAWFSVQFGFFARNAGRKTCELSRGRPTMPKKSSVTNTGKTAKGNEKAVSAKARQRVPIQSQSPLQIPGKGYPGEPVEVPANAVVDEEIDFLPDGCHSESGGDPNGHRIQESLVELKKELDSLPYKDVETCVQAMDRIVSLIKTIADFTKLDTWSDECLSAVCDEYTKAARSFAALILAERVRRIFRDKIDLENEKSQENLQEKQATAEIIRKLLSPWSLGFIHEGDKKSGLFQIYACAEKSSDGAYRFVGYGNSGSLTALDEIRKAVNSPILGDASVFSKRPNLRGPTR
jgi:hypothetical protein